MSKSLMVVIQTKKSILVCVHTFTPQIKATAQIPASCCFLEFWILWICTSKIRILLWSQISHSHAFIFAHSDAVGIRKNHLQQ